MGLKKYSGSIGKQIEGKAFNLSSGNLVVDNLPFKPALVIITGTFVTSDSNRWMVTRAVKSNLLPGATGFLDNKLIYNNSVYSETKTTNEYGSSGIVFTERGFAYPSSGGASQGSWIAISE